MSLKRWLHQLLCGWGGHIYTADNLIEQSYRRHREYEDFGGGGAFTYFRIETQIYICPDCGKHIKEEKWHLE